jgi:CRISPR-associated protein Csd1
MILQALCDYYERKAADPATPPPGYEWREIPFIVELHGSGEFFAILDVREGEGKSRRGKRILLPQGPVGRTSGIKPYLLADNVEYLFADSKKREAFVALIQKIPDWSGESDLVATLRFLETVDLDRLKEQPLWAEIETSKASIAFRIRGESNLVGQSEVVRKHVEDHPNLDADFAGVCSLSGEMTAIAKLHPLVSGVRGAKTTGAALVSFQKDSGYDSYGKEQANNAPVGKRATFAYTTALKHLLRRDSSQKLQVGDATTVFWADHETSLENDFAVMFDEPHKDDADPDRGTRAVAALLDAARQGVGPVLDDKTRFFVLGLAPNAARIAIRFWQVGTVAEMAARIVRHFTDLEIDRHPEAKPFLPIRQLLIAVAAQGDADSIPPNLGGDVLRAILEGLPYPETLFSGAVRRIRAEQSKKDPRTGKLVMNVTYARAAILKACLNRRIHQTGNPFEKEITVSLDKDNINPGYRLGRLFAVLERVQEEASPGLNATIRDRYYGAFSATPATVFATLMRMKNHHLAKLDNRGRRVNLEKLIGEIVDGLTPTLPAHLPLADQGRFAIGYYHQRQDFFTKHESVATDPSLTAKD